jgi:hypothetical protein
MALTESSRRFAIEQAIKVASAWAESPATNKMLPEDIFEAIYKKLEKILTN